ncbi:MAG: zinc-binding dehydrogenase [Chloroflexota bacterium]|nr:zinc-binding dehydrogenase [Chloroflexota bacterium]MDE2960678.1 zinc-binding dehydrogenase [Chloroflexota bacterium]
MKGRIVVVKEYGKPFEIEEYDVPEPQPGAVLLRMTQAGICGSDLHTWRGDQTQEHNPLPPTGRVMGHEGTGVIEHLGDGITTDYWGTDVKEGDRVVYAAVFPCYHCHMCLRGNTNWCANRQYPAAGNWPYFTGTYGDFLYLPPRHPFFRVPDELPDNLLGPVNCAMGTVTTGLERAGMSHGQSVVIMGAGGLGIHATAMAKERGADRVIVLDRLENRLALAEEFGADETINIEEFNTPETRVRRVRELTRGRGADVVMELVGRADLLREGIDMLSNGGTFVEIGDIVRGQETSIDPSKLLQGKNIVGSLMYRPSLLPELLDFLVRNQDRLPFNKLVSHTFPLADVNEAFVAAEWSQRQTEITRAMLVP